MKEYDPQYCDKKQHVTDWLNNEECIDSWLG